MGLGTTFPTPPSNGDSHPLQNGEKIWIYDGNKWDLQPLVDEFTADLPVVKNDTINAGVGRDIEHSFSIWRLSDIETFSGQTPNP